MNPSTNGHAMHPADLSDERLALLDRLLRQEGLADGPGAPIPRRQGDGPWPLSFAQERMWVLDRIDPGSPAYHMFQAVRLEGPLDEAALRRSLDDLVRRHESLRTTFSVDDGRPWQVIAPAGTLPLAVVDLSGLPADAADAEARRLVAAEAVRPFDLERGPLARAGLLRLGPDAHVFMLNVHHIVSDGWSMAVLAREITATYTALRHGGAPPLAAPAIRYADFAVWHREQAERGAHAEQIDYWRRQLAGPPAPLDLPTDFARPAAQTYRGARESRRLPAPLTAAVHALCRREGLTPFMALLAAFDVLLLRQTGQDDVVVGTPIAGRNRAEIESLIGCFVNSLALRTDLSGDPSFRALAGRVRDVALAAYAHQDVPFEKLLEVLQLARDPGRTPLFQVFFNVLNFEHDLTGLPGITSTPMAQPDPGSKFDLTLYVAERDGRFHLTLVYNADLFLPARMADLLEQLELILDQAMADPDRPISRYALLTATARRLVPDPRASLTLEACGSLIPDAPVDHDPAVDLAAPVVPDAPVDRAAAGIATVVGAFTRQAARAPDRRAIADAHGTCTYRQLDDWTGRIAAALVAGGVAPGDIVAIHGHRGAALAAALLGTLKAGAAFVIVDPAQPAARSADCLTAVRPRAWVELTAAGSPPAALDACVTGLGCHRVRIAPAYAGIDDGPPSTTGNEAAVAVGPHDLAYVAFTSGSSGRPKGILGEHGPLVRFVDWHRRTFGLDETDRFALLSGLAHDPLLRDVFTPLALGALLCVPDPAAMTSPHRLRTWLAESGVTVVHLTPALGLALAETAGLADGGIGGGGARAGGDRVGVDRDGMDAAGGAALPALRHAFFAGDTLTRDVAARWRRLAPSARVVNFYGATETPQAVAFAVVADPAAGGPPPAPIVPIGRGIDGMQLLVLDATGRQAGIGEIGEVHVRGPQLARGYLGDDALTRARFVVNPFTAAPHDRVYRTGDMGRYLPDGAVAFLGRRDRQVKIRGYRIELEEIEAVLGQHPAVRACAVVAVVAGDDAAADPSPRLVAYVVGDADGPNAGADLRDHLRARLPDCMAPAAFVPLPALPLTPNGKLDRRRLPRHEPETSQTPAAFTPASSRQPRTAAERLMADLWLEILDVEAVETTDNFFDLGGSSLMALQVVARFENRTGVRINAVDMGYQTLGQLAAPAAAAAAGIPPERAPT